MIRIHGWVDVHVVRCAVGLRNDMVKGMTTNVLRSGDMLCKSEGNDSNAAVVDTSFSSVTRPGSINDVIARGRSATIWQYAKF